MFRSLTLIVNIWIDNKYRPRALLESYHWLRTAAFYTSFAHLNSPLPPSLFLLPSFHPFFLLSGFSRTRGGRALSKNRRASNNEPGAAARATRVEVCIVNAYRAVYMTTWYPPVFPLIPYVTVDLTQWPSEPGPKRRGNARAAFTLDPELPFSLSLSLSILVPPLFHPVIRDERCFSPADRLWT